MRIFLTGATGFIGGHILRSLSDRGHQVTCLARGNSAAQLRSLALTSVQIVEGEFTAPADYVKHVAGHDVVINAVGIIRETSSATFDSVHTRAPIVLFDAALAAGVRKCIQISALGADDAAQSRYHLSKRAADRHLASLQVPWVVLRPSLVYGPGDHSMTFFESLAALPIAPVPGDGQYPLQPIHMDDLVRAVVLAVEREELAGVAVDVGGAEPMTFDRILDVLAMKLGKRRTRKLHIPISVMELTARGTDALGRGPISGDELSMLRRGNVADNRPFIECFGFAPVAFGVGIARKPFTEADRWHARIANLRLPLRWSIAFVWLATGIVSAFFSTAEGFELLRQVGITGPLANLALYGTAYFEIAIGLATALGWRVRRMALIQLVLMFGFMLILTFGIPALWLHPFGPLTKNIPLIVATLVMMALEE
ncbi:MAG: NAD(P)H-binding protein [Gemmataceae bacterium]|nr:NAD(P)H-binding protein [Gemmataceae bacterium]